MKNIFKIILGYVVFYILDILIFSCLLYKYSCKLDISFVDFLCYYFINENVKLNNNIMTGVICLIQNITEVFAVAVFTGYIFAFILNREPRIIFPEKLVIRHRTTWEAKNKLTLGILIGNRNHYVIHNAVCSVTCSYIKKLYPLQINSEFTLTDERISLENFYRFSFDLAKFPRQVLKDIIEKPIYLDKETIVVSITGNCNYLGNSFKVSKTYNLSEIVYDERTPDILHPRKNIFTGKNLVNPFTKKDLERIDWKEIKRFTEVNEEKRNISVKEIKCIIKNKKKIKSK